MSGASLVVAISVGGAVLALWTFVRFPQLTPPRAGMRMVHLVVALAFAQFVAPAVMTFVIHGSNALGPTLLALFFVFLPSQLYAYLGGIWVLALLRNALQPR
jgi:hypothetical protein